MTGHLIFQDGTTYTGESFGSTKSRAGEIVFATGMTGYPEGITDPSYKGQILVLTYPLIGNYGVPNKRYWESENIMISGLIVSTYNDTPSHTQNERSLSEWLQHENIPALVVKDTRFLAQKLRDEGSKLGKIVIKDDIAFYDPNKENLVSLVASKHMHIKKTPIQNAKTKTILYLDCGGKRNMISCLLSRNAHVVIIPWDYDPFEIEGKKKLSEFLRKANLPQAFDGIVVSNGPGDPKFADKTIAIVQKALQQKIPLLGICLGHQILCLAAGGSTKKLKFGHRSQNQPSILTDSNRCYITTQNHGFAVSKIPPGFKTWFTNANDGSNEGIIHTKLPFMSVQFHPEATPGPQDTEWIFDAFLEKIKK